MFILHFCINSLGGFYIKVKCHCMESKTGSLHDLRYSAVIYSTKDADRQWPVRKVFIGEDAGALNPAITCYVHHLLCNLSFDWTTHTIFSKSDSFFQASLCDHSSNCEFKKPSMGSSEGSTRGESWWMGFKAPVFQMCSGPLRCYAATDMHTLSCKVNMC